MREICFLITKIISKSACLFSPSIYNRILWRHFFKENKEEIRSNFPHSQSRSQNWANDDKCYTNVVRFHFVISCISEQLSLSCEYVEKREDLPESM